MKVMESAREAVANGSAGSEEIQMATNGVEVNDDGKVVPASPPTNHTLPGINGNHSVNGQRNFSIQASPRNRMEIGLHNQADFEYTEL